MISFRLANVLLKQDSFIKDYQELYFRGAKCAFDDTCDALACRGRTDFMTYFNALSIAKWRRYTTVDQVKLHLELSGAPCAIRLLHADGDAAIVFGSELARFAGSDEGQRCTIEVDLPFRDKDVLMSFAIEPDISHVAATLLHAAWYFTECEESAIRPVRIVLSTTTYKKEDFITANIKAIRSELLEGDDPIAEHFYMYVVDNGRTLDAEQLGGGGVTIISNDNVGGSGGFTRGMIEALHSDFAPTHILLMDDDIHVFPESYKRTFSLLSLANDHYAQAFVNGAMLSFEQPDMQFEDVAAVRKSGIYARIKPDLYLGETADIVQNETIDTEIERAYGAWWYSCIPLSAVREHGLPLPLFVRCDDVEFGIRCKPLIMSMNGICVWHADFEGRFRPSVDCYQFIRNFLIMIAVDAPSSTRLFMMRFDRTFRTYLRAMNYGAAELLLDGLEDYLKGPDYLVSLDPVATVAANGAKNEKLEPLNDLAEREPELFEGLEIDIPQMKASVERSFFLRVLELLPYDRHMLPDWALKDDPAAVLYSTGAYPASKARCRRTLVALDMKAEHGCIRRMDRDRYRKLRARHRELKARFRAENDSVAAQWRDAMPHLSSEEFWRSYLHMDA